MQVAHSQPAELCADDQRQLQAWVEEFEQGWNEERLSDQVLRLPESGPLRTTALVALACSDLARRWERGDRPLVESYLHLYPELGSPATVPAELIQAELDVRRRHGLIVGLDDLVRRFPGREMELRNLLGSLPTASDQLQQGPADMPGAPVLPLPEQFGRYRILGQLGKGGMGAVHLAYDTHLERKVALKVPHFGPESTPEVFERFRREARAAAALDHPSLCPVHDVGEIEGIHYLTMPYIEGKPLSALINPARPLPPGFAVAVVRQVALAVEEAHRKGLVHRDLKPSNIMINQRQEPVVMDFGLAHRCTAGGEPRLTHNGTIIGTPAYMAPEQIGGKGEIGPGCDIYSLGVILYELLTGTLPFQGSVMATLGQVLTMEPKPPSHLRPGLGTQLDTICLKALAKLPADRFRSMSELAEALSEYLGADNRNAAVALLASVSGSPLRGDETVFTGQQDDERPCKTVGLPRRSRRVLVSCAIGISATAVLAATVAFVAPPTSHRKIDGVNPPASQHSPRSGVPTDQALDFDLPSGAKPLPFSTSPIKPFDIEQLFPKDAGPNLRLPPDDPPPAFLRPPGDLPSTEKVYPKGARPKASPNRDEPNLDLPPDEPLPTVLRPAVRD